MTDPFSRYGAFIYRWRWPVLLAWLVVLGVCGGVFAPKASGVLKAGGISVPGSDSDVASRILAQEFKVSALNNVAVVFRSNTTVDDPAYQSQVEAAAQRMSKVEGVTGVVTYYASGLETLVSKDRKTSIMFVSLKGDEGETQTYVEGVRTALKDITIEHYVTGPPAINHDFQATSEKDLRRAEMVTIPLVLLLLLLTFRTIISAAVPLVLGGAAVVLATAAIYFIGNLTNTSLFALNVASMIGLGLGIDFSLIVVNRFREEMAKRGDPRAATAMTMATAGRSIVYSGVTVLLGMLLLTLMVDLMVVRSISLGVMLVAMTALLGGVTLLPAVLGILAHRLEWLRVIPQRRGRREDEGFWYRYSHAIMRRPWAWLAVSLVIIGVIAFPARELKMIGSNARLLPSSTESVKGLNILNAEFGENLLSPIQIVLKTHNDGGVFTPQFLTGLDKLTNTLTADPRAESVSSLATYMAAEPRYDGRFANLKADHDFMPAPDLSHLQPGEVAPGVSIQNYIDVWTDHAPQNPGYFGFGLFKFDRGTNQQLQVTPTLQVYRVNSGNLTVNAGGPVTLWRYANFGQRDKGENIANGTDVVLATGDQLVVPPQTPVTLRVEGDPVEMIAAVGFNVRPGLEQQDSWTEGDPTSDPFQGIPRQVIGGGIGMTFPKGPANIKLDLSLTKPGAWFPRHLHPGPELIVVKSGTLTIFSSPEMVMTGSDGRVKEGPYDQPIDLGARGKAVVQGYGIHRATDRGTDDAEVWSLRVLDAEQPAVSLIAVREIAATFVNLDSGNNTAVVNVVPRFGPYDANQEQFVKDMRNLIIPNIPELANSDAYVGGTTANFMDFHDELYGRFPYLVGAVLLLTFIILMMFFQSVFLPFKAILMNLGSILATYGALVLIFQHGWGSSLAGFEPLGAIAVITPAILFVILFSLSTDYEVFMLSRIKEYYHQTHNNEEAVAAGMQHTAGVITAAGLILIGVFGSFATAGIITIKEIGLGLAIAVLLDTTVVRTIMVPATMRLAGNVNWTMPAWLKRIVPELREGPVDDMVPAAATVSPAGSEVAYDGLADVPSVIIRPRMAGQLRPIGGSVGTDLIRLPRARPFTIGRDDASDLQVYDPRVSRQHARIEYVRGDYVITDLESTNGIYVNGQRITGPTVLRNGDEVEIANTGEVRFTFETRPLSEAPVAAAGA